MSLLSDQVDKKEIEIIIREFKRIIKNGINGDVVEFGCYLGTTSVYLAGIIDESKINSKLYVYDSFEGLPEKTKEDISPLGDQFKVGELLAPKKQFIKNMMQAKVSMPVIKKAWFSDLIDSDVPEKISFAFLDGDYYASIIDPLKLIKSKMLSGATIVVDDYGNAALPGAKKAVDEWIQKNPEWKLRVEYSLAIIYIK